MYNTIRELRKHNNRIDQEAPEERTGEPKPRAKASTTKIDLSESDAKAGLTKRCERYSEELKEP